MWIKLALHVAGWLLQVGSGVMLLIAFFSWWTSMESAMSADDDNPPAKDDENKYAVFHNSPQNDYLYKKILNTIGLSCTTCYGSFTLRQMDSSAKLDSNPIPVVGR